MVMLLISLLESTVKSTICHMEQYKMGTFNGLTIEEAVKQGKLIPIDTKDPNWVDKLTEMVQKPKGNSQHTKQSRV
jgi:hypothetical protein